MADLQPVVVVEDLELERGIREREICGGKGAGQRRWSKALVKGAGQRRWSKAVLGGGETRLGEGEFFDPDKTLDIGGFRGLEAGSSLSSKWSTREESSAQAVLRPTTTRRMLDELQIGERGGRRGGRGYSDWESGGLARQRGKQKVEGQPEFTAEERAKIQVE